MWQHIRLRVKGINWCPLWTRGMERWYPKKSLHSNSTHLRFIALSLIKHDHRFKERHHAGAWIYWTALKWHHYQIQISSLINIFRKQNQIYLHSSFSHENFSVSYWCCREILCFTKYTAWSANKLLSHNLGGNCTHAKLERVLYAISNN